MAVSTHEGLFLESIEELAYYKYELEEIGTSLDEPKPAGCEYTALSTIDLRLADNCGPTTDRHALKAAEWLKARKKYNPIRYELESDRTTPKTEDSSND